MQKDRAFQIALLVSVVAHSLFLVNLPDMPFMPSKGSLQQIEITYYEIKKEPVEKEELIGKKQEPIARKLPEIKREEILKPPMPAGKDSKKTGEREKQVVAVEEVELKEKTFETVVQEEKDDTKRATYISYYRVVRERIRQYVDRNYSRSARQREGEVFLSFVVASSGELLHSRVIDEKSVDSAPLRNISLDSIKDASPFPPFPEGMSQYQITFNVVISFELNK